MKNKEYKKLIDVWVVCAEKLAISSKEFTPRQKAFFQNDVLNAYKKKVNNDD